MPSEATIRRRQKRLQQKSRRSRVTNHSRSSDPVLRHSLEKIFLASCAALWIGYLSSDDIKTLALIWVGTSKTTTLLMSEGFWIPFWGFHAANLCSIPGIKRFGIRNIFSEDYYYIMCYYQRYLTSNILELNKIVNSILNIFRRLEERKLKHEEILRHLALSPRRCEQNCSKCVVHGIISQDFFWNINSDGGEYETVSTLETHERYCIICRNEVRDQTLLGSERFDSTTDFKAFTAKIIGKDERLLTTDNYSFD
ncbi:MAG: hypothetical protein Harvfovirus20_4 [Harvfovirus sp.]|uniref:Uncharacterized protein n=1 Tax=Harvfovirus sp. TaxID=2487768 RepID=A0A3G5A1V8_9VIRU|nr:MAG: hypothetical protein Harvfovirus20_4 [Harvfovirus sp.]